MDLPDVSMKPPADGVAHRAPWSLRLISLLLASMLLLLAMIGITTWNLNAQRVDGDWVAHTNVVRYELLRILQLLVDADGGARDFADSGSEQALQAYETATPQLDPVIARLGQLVSDNPQQQALAARIADFARELEAANARLLTEARAGHADNVQSLLRDPKLAEAMTGARALLAGMQAEEDRLLVERRAVRDQARADATLALWGTGALGALLLVLVVYFTRRDEAELHLAERELATTLRSVGDAVIATDVNEIVRFMNPIAAQLTGWTESEARGKPLREVFRIIGEETRAPVASPVQRVLQEGRRVQLANHTVLVARDGSERAIADSGAPVFDDAGKIKGAVLVFRDVSEERRDARALRLLHEELQIINDYARFPVARCDAQYRFLFVNKAYAERHGLEPEQCIGKPIREIVGDPAFESVRPYIDTAIGGRVVEFEIEIPYSGVYGRRWMRCIYAPVREADGEIHSFVAAVTDISDRKLAEMALQEADRRKDEFIATLSHELRNPLAPIRTAARILASPQLTHDGLQRAQSIIERQVTHMALLLDDLLDIGRITQGKLRLKKELVALSGAVDAAIEAARPLLDAKSHELNVRLPKEPIVLEADPLRLAQILSNLLMNAAKYSDPGSRIEVSAEREGNNLALSVKDDGIGIAPEHLTGIFDMFAQIEGLDGRADGGLGIGLALVKGLTELHGGSVAARSAGLGHGSEFLLHLPLPVQAPDAASLGAGPAPRTTERRKLLIVDDNRDAAESLAMLLEMAGHDVRVAYLGRTALAYAQTFRPDVALLDIGMPDLSGYEVARGLRQQPWAAGLQLIAITGWGQDEDRRRAAEAGFDNHLTKPIDPAQLERLIGNPAAQEPMRSEPISAPAQSQ